MKYYDLREDWHGEMLRDLEEARTCIREIRTLPSNSYREHASLESRISRALIRVQCKLTALEEFGRTA